MSTTLPKLLFGLALTCPMTSASANVIADWDATAVAIVASALPGPPAEREMALVHAAMFDAVNAIERRYRPYLIELTAAPTTSQEAAAAMAAATVLTALPPEAASDLKAKPASPLATIPDREAKAEGVKLGQAGATQVLPARPTHPAPPPPAP